MNCSSSKPNDAIGCLAGHLLATEYNLLNGTDACIAAVVGKADAFLSGQVVDGVTGIKYTGPGGKYSAHGGSAQPGDLAQERAGQVQQQRGLLNVASTSRGPAQAGPRLALGPVIMARCGSRSA